MPRTLTDLLQGTFIRLNEGTASTFAELESGGGNTPVLATTAVMTRYINEAQWEMARTCLLIPGRAAALTTAGQARYLLSDMAAQMDRTQSIANLYSDGSTAWAVRQVILGGTALTFSGVEALMLRFPNFENTTASGTALYWYRNGEGAFGIWPAPAAAAGITAVGYVVGPSFDTSATCTWIADNLTPLIEMRAAALLAEHSFDDPTLYGRLQHLNPEYNTGRQALYERIPNALARDLELAPIVQQAVKGKQ